MASPYGNTFSGAASGRPPIYKSPKKMAEKIIEYLESIQEKTIKGTNGTCDRIIEGEPITITGLCLFLGFESRQSFYDYEKREEFSYLIKKARLLVENRYEKALATKEVTGAIFALKNMGWKDKIEQGFTDADGNDVSPVAIFQLPDNGRVIETKGE
jgi:hypothetical protein